MKLPILMLRGNGGWREDCRFLSGCMRDVAIANWSSAHCGESCGAFVAIPAWEQAAIRMDGLGRSPLADAVDEGDDVVAMPKVDTGPSCARQRISAALVAGPMTNPALMAALGMPHDTVKGVLRRMRNVGQVVQVGTVKPSNKYRAKPVALWALATKEAA
jgi:hypothetical protein